MNNSLKISLEIRSGIACIPALKCQLLIQYVICKDTLDPYLYKSIQWKLETIDGCLDQRSDRNFKGMDIKIYDMEV